MESPWLTLEALFCFFVDLEYQNGRRVPGAFFSDPGMEMMPGCRGCMCYNHSKNKCFRDISLFLRIREFSVSREGFRSHFGDFW